MRTLLMWLLCPGYFSGFPEKDEPGPWVACSTRRHCFSTVAEEHEVRVVKGGLRKAYKTARWLGLRADWKLGRYWSVGYGVRRLRFSSAD